MFPVDFTMSLDAVWNDVISPSVPSVPVITRKTISVPNFSFLYCIQI